MRWTSLLCMIVAIVLVPASPIAQKVTATSSAAPVPPVANACLRPDAGSVVRNPVALFSSNGVLNVRFSYQHRIDSSGRELFNRESCSGKQLSGSCSRSSNDAASGAMAVPSGSI
jgi:hypothetical protein